MSVLPNEYRKVELPFIQQLQAMGWTWLNDADGDTSIPYLTERDSFRQVLLFDRLRDALKRINPNEDGQPWLDDRRLSIAISELDRPGALNLLEKNEKVYQLLRLGVPVPGAPDQHGDRDVTIQYIDYEHPERNDFLIINQFRVDPPWSVGDKDFSIPDIVLFVNGIPLVVIECKDTDATDPMHEGIHQLLRYSNQHDIEREEGAERLFWYNQLMIATFWYKAKAGAVGATLEHYLEWKEAVPVAAGAFPSNDILAKTPTSQQILAAGMLHPIHLLDIVRNFILFKDNSGQRIKVVPRYQQFRAVQKTIHRLQTGQTREMDGEHDRRGGIIWHTQGSGKSLTMVFLVRKMRTMRDLRRFKIVIVTDRIDLEEQLRETATLTGEPVRPNQYDRRPRESATNQLQRILIEEGSGMVFAMIQKYQERETDLDLSAIEALPRSPEYQALPLAAEIKPTYITDAAREKALALQNESSFPVLNTATEILVLVDEAHRSHTTNMHANLMQALPNCVKIGFTGTPILIGARKRTHEIFGPFIDKYTIKQSEEDGMTVPIRYEGYTTDAEVYEGQGLDQLFEDMFKERTPEELEAIKQKYATAGNVLESKKMVQAKARHLLQHYIRVVLPEGFKAQVVAVSRKAAVRYQKYLEEARLELLTELASLDAALLTLDEATLLAQDVRTQFLLAAYPHLETIKRLHFATVISAGRSNDPEKQDPPEWRQWSDRSNINHHIAEFKKPLHHTDKAKQSGLAILCVKSMLLTGFDAPVEQAMYLDRSMQGHELLQAIARVNRTAPNKEQGIVVDYYGVSRHLKEALNVYTDEDVEGALTSIKDELPKLAARHQRVLDLFAAHGIDDIYSGMDDCVFLLENARIRAEFTVKLKQFLTTLNNVLPRPEALPYWPDAKMLGIIAKSAANLYRDDQINIAGVGNKVSKLIDDHLRANGIDPTIPPISITDAEFETAVHGRRSDRAQALEMQHALRYHISQVYREDPVYYKKLSERLEAILQHFVDNWQAQIEALEDLIRESRQAESQEDSVFDKRTPAAFFRLLAEEAQQDGDLTSDDLDRLVNVTFAMVEHIRQDIQKVDFWRNPVAQENLRSWILQFLDNEEIIANFDRVDAIAGQIVDIARANHMRLTS
ncbi:MAG: type I restriction endonuclease subunit R [Ardenticatenaceae bacterium]|nr:type I restriction endonuclease subunit R [Ardenticatenaceae bacterium]